jgi:class 3 adenylate cyclase/predicted ATPase
MRALEQRGTGVLDTFTEPEHDPREPSPLGFIMDVVVWLRSLGLGRYEAAFRENEIDETVLPSLTAEDLKDLGVSIVGHRRKILDAIAALRTDTGGKAPPTHALTTSTLPTASPEERAERRQVTVMFSDLVGSTALSARMDPEDLREVIAAYHKCAAEIVQRFDGFLAQFLGDGVLVYFGYPKAHEDDAERAVRTGLELITAVCALTTSVSLQIRVGIASGPVVVGDIMRSGNAIERGIVGETPNLAARIQGIAAPNAVVIAESTRKLLGDLFELEDLGAKDLKGIAGPVRTWAVLRPASVESRFEAMHQSGVTALIGREEELELLLRRWSKAKLGEGQVVLLSGEAGIGKSRLIAALLERLASEPHTPLRYFCSQQHTDSAFFPIISQIERAAGFRHADTAQVKLGKLDAVLALTSTPKQNAALFAEMLSLPNDGRYPALELTPPQRRQKTLEALFAQVETFSRKGPVLMIFEDAHWADPTSLEAFGRAVDRIKTFRVLLIITYRPEFQAPWIGLPHVTALTLNRLTRREIEAMIDQVAGNKPTPANIRQEIIERTDGIPLFVEEMTKAVLEAETQSGAERTAAAIPPLAVAVPASLHASLMARLDRLGGPAKEVAQIGAALGREFPHSLLRTVVGKPEAELQAALDRIVTAGLMFQHGVPPHATYLFKHALVQDAAYGTLLHAQRRTLHARIVATLEIEFPEVAESQPELLARHCAAGGLIERAAGFWGKAGQRSLARSALLEAVEQLTHALDLIASLPATTVLRREQIKLQVALINPLMHIKGYAAPETKAAEERARLLMEQAEALGEPLEDPLLLFSVLYSYWVANALAFNGDVMLELGAQFLKLAEKQKATGLLVVAHRMMAASLAPTGDLLAGRAHCDQALALYNLTVHRDLATLFGQDLRVSVLAFRCVIMWRLGYPATALADAANAIKHAREIGQAGTLMFALCVSSQVPVVCGDYVTANALVDEAIALADQKGGVYWKVYVILTRGCILALTGKASEAVRTITFGLSELRSTGTTTGLPLYLLFLAMAHAEVSQFDDAWHRVGEAMTVMEAAKEKWWEPEVNRIAGEIALKSPEHDAAKAEAYFGRALTVARQQQAKSWELRAAMSLARLWRGQSKQRQARELLAPVYGWFTEGFDTRDLKEAKALLEELA